MFSWSLRPFWRLALAALVAHAPAQEPATTVLVGRVVDGFPSDQQNQIRQQLSLGLAAVVAQQLVPSADGKRRHLAAEVLMGNNAVSNLIRRGEDHMLRSQLSLGRAEGMVMMEQSLARLVKKKLISAETAEAHCQRPDELRRYLQS